MNTTNLAMSFGLYLWVVLFLMFSGDLCAGRHYDKQFRPEVYHTEYHSYNDINRYLKYQRNRYRSLVSVHTLNHETYEQRSVTYIKISNWRNQSVKRSIIIEAAIHAREWIAPGSTLYFIHKLLTEYSNANKKAWKMVDYFDWYIVPVTNPDGYEYSRQGKETRLWRKNRRPIEGMNCVGVDGNRNFGSMFYGQAGASDDCSSIVFHGPNPFSEAETKNIRDLFLEHNDTLAAFISLHSFTQGILVPITAFRPDFFEPFVEEFAKENKTFYFNPKKQQMLDVGYKMNASMYEATGRNYSVGDLYNIIPGALASGTSLDWAAETNPTILSYLFELPPADNLNTNDEQLFILPPSEIIPTGNELYAAFETMALAMLSDTNIDRK